MRIAALVPAHDRQQALRQVLSALAAQSRPPDAVVVIDHSGDEATRALLAAFPQVTVVPGGQPHGGLGPGIAHAQAAGFDWFWLLKHGTVPRPDALAWLASAAESSPLFTGAVCCAVRERGAIARRHRCRQGMRFGFSRALPLAAYTKQAARVDSASFCGFLVAAQAAAHVGLPDARLVCAHADTDYSLRLRKAGWDIWMVPASVVDYAEDQEPLAGGAPGQRYFDVRNRIAVARRYARRPFVAGCGAALQGALMWTLRPTARLHGGLRIFWKAVADGFAGRLGGLPAALARPHPGRGGRR